MYRLDDFVDEKVSNIKKKMDITEKIRKTLKDKVEKNIDSLFESNLLLQKVIQQHTEDLEKEIKERKKVEEALRESEEMFRSIADLAQDGIILMDNFGNISFWNKASERIFGHTSEEVIGKQLHRLFSPKRYHDSFKQGFARFQKSGTGPIVGKTTDIMALRKNGAEFPIELSISSFTIKSKWNAIGIVRDITERKWVEDTVRQSEERHKRLVGAVTTYTYTVLVENGMAVGTTHSEGCLEVTGYNPSEYHADPHIWFSMIHEKDRGAVLKHAENILSGKAEMIEHRIVHKDGSVRWVRNTPVLHYNEKNSLIAYDGLIVDITEDKNAEEALRKYGKKLEICVKEQTTELAHAKNYLESVLSSMTDSLLVLNSTAVIQTVNQPVCTLLGYSQNELIGISVDTIFVEASISQVIPEVLQKETIKDLFMTMKTKNAEEIPVLVNLSTMGNNEEDIILIAHDMREIKKFEEETKKIQVKMLAASKMATLGEIATGIAHEINQPLTYISSFIQGLQADAKKDKIAKEELMEGLQVSLRQVGRIVDIIQHLRTFGRRNELILEPLLIEQVLDNTLLLLGERIRLMNIEFKKNVVTDLPHILGNANQLEQVFINLFQNAMDALTEGSEKRKISVRISLSGNMKFIIIKLSDNGAGIDKENLEKIFDPFFTTKEVGKGTGLGLSIVYGILQEHNGTITCDSVKNKKTTFTIMIPVINNSENELVPETDDIE